MEMTSALAVEKSAGDFHVISERGELELYEGGCRFEPGTRSFEYPYDCLAERIDVPKDLIDRLCQNVKKLSEIMDREKWIASGSEGERVELAILKDERELALLAQKQGIGLEKYFESYKGLAISW